MGWPYNILLEKYIEMFHKEGEKVISGFCKLKVPRDTFLNKYNSLPEKLENMDAEEKTKLKKYVNELFTGETPHFRIDACKIIFTLNYCL
jgi:hypothetical protein